MPFRDLISPIVRSRTLWEVSILAVVTGLYAGLAVWKETSHLEHVGDMPSEFHTVLTIVLGLLLVFRTNAAYSRWWEARTLWGQLVNASRNLAAKFKCLIHLPRDQVAAAAHLVIAFAFALKNHLRSAKTAQLPGGVQLPSNVQHGPSFLVQRLYSLLCAWKVSGRALVLT